MRTLHHRGPIVLIATLLAFLVPAGTALACGGLVAPNGTVSLLRTTTLAAYHDGIEHYVTSFSFAGASSGEFGSIIPLPGEPTRLIKGGDWTLQRLVLETQPVQRTALFAAEDTAFAPASAQVVLEKKIDALELTVLKGGAVAVGDWAREHGFFLPPDAPEVLAFYADRSPYFMAARFDAAEAAARGINEGDGTPVHLVIPTENPWVPLRILGLGRGPNDLVEADVFLLTDTEPAMLPQAVRNDPFDPEQRGVILRSSAAASDLLLSDLRTDRGMGWVPDRSWLTYLDVNTRAGDLTFDLAIDASGAGRPDPAATGLEPGALSRGSDLASTLALGALLVVVLAFAAALIDRRSLRRPAV